MSKKQTVSFLLETILDDDNRNVSLRATFLQAETNQSAVLNQDTIIELLKKHGYSQYFQFNEQIAGIAEELAKKLEELENSDAWSNQRFETPVVATAIDAIAEVIIAEDNMQASILLTPAKGGKQLELEQAKAILSESGVVYGVDEQSLLRLLQLARQSDSCDNIEKLIAVAKQPVVGHDSQFIPLVDTVNERILKPQLRDDGTIDMRELGDLPIVKANQAIMRKQPFTLGKAGIDVRGSLIEAEPGKAFDFEIASGSRLNPSNSLELLADINGQPNLLGNGMKVDSVVKVKVVDLSTGNLDVDANLIVEGDITECMKVKCSGDITIGGVIESAHVEAEGSIMVGRGIVGHIPKHQQGQDNKLSTFVRAGNRINAVFSSYSKLQAEEEIHLDEQILHCDCSSQKRVTVGSSKATAGQIIGGITRAGQSIEADIVGAPVSILTRIDLSGSYQKEQDKISVVRQEIDEKNLQLSALKNSYAKYTSRKLSPEGQVQANKIKNTIFHLNQEIDQLEVDSQTIRETRDTALEQMQVRVKRRVNIQVEVKIGAQKFKSQRAMESGIISLVDGEVRFQAKNLEKD